jgi:nicotinamidase-related amidase
MKTALLIIDPQNDFCIPGASLFVPGADADMHRLSSFLICNPDFVDTIHVSLDMHNIDDIAHPNYWINSESKHPEPFTNITVEDLESGKWVTKSLDDHFQTLEYLKFLKTKNKFTHTIWPVHCVAGTYGSNIFPVLSSALKKWMDSTKKSFRTYIKGMDRNSEHFGIFQSEDGKSEFNINLLDELFVDSENILVAGQAKSHCVATSLKQILDANPRYIKRITLLTDTTSNVTGCEQLADGIYAELRAAGMKEVTTIDYTIKIQKEREILA